MQSIHARFCVDYIQQLYARYMLCVCVCGGGGVRWDQKLSMCREYTSCGSGSRHFVSYIHYTALHYIILNEYKYEQIYVNYSRFFFK